MKADFHGPHLIIDRFVTLLDICQRINSEKNFDDLLNIIATEAAKLVDAERSTIFLIDAKKGELWAKVALGTSEVIRFDSRMGIAGAVMKTGKTMIVDDAYNSPLFYPAIDSLTGSGASVSLAPYETTGPRSSESSRSSTNATVASRSKTINSLKPLLLRRRSPLKTRAS